MKSIVFLKYALLLLVLPLVAKSQDSEKTYLSSWYQARDSFGDRYDVLQPFSLDLAKVCADGNCGLIDKNGHVLLPLEYTIPYDFYGAVLQVKQNDQVGAVNRRGKIVIPVAYSGIATFQSSKLVGVCRDSVWAVFDTSGMPLTPFMFTNIESLNDNFIIASSTYGAYYGVWDTQMHHLISEIYHQIIPLPAGFWQATLYGQSALLGPDGVPRTGFLYQNVLGMPDGSYLATSCSRHDMRYWYDSSGNRRSDTLYQVSGDYYSGNWYIRDPNRNSIVLHYDGTIILQSGTLPSFSTPDPNDPADWKRLKSDNEDNNTGWYDLKTGHFEPAVYYSVICRDEQVLASDYDQTYIFNRSGVLLKTYPFSTALNSFEKLWIVSNRQGLYGLCDTAFNMVLKPEAGEIQRNEWGGFTQKTDNQVYLYNSAGNAMYSDLVINSLAAYSENNYARFQSGALYGLLHSNGSVVLPAIYEEVFVAGRDRFIVKKSGRFGVIDRRGKEILPINLEKIEVFSNSVLLLSQSEKKGLAAISTGKILLPIKYEKITRSQHYFLTQREGKYGLYDDNGKCILKENYEDISWWNNLWLIAEHGKWGLLNKRFEIVLPLEYQKIVFVNGIAVATRDSQITRWVRRGDHVHIVHTERLAEWSSWKSGMLITVEKDKAQLCDRQYEPLLPGKYDQILPIGQPGVMALVRLNNQVSCIAPDQKITCTFEADSLLSWKNELVIYLKKQERWLRHITTGVTMKMPDGQFEIIECSPLFRIFSKNQVSLYDQQFDQGPIWQGESISFQESGNSWPIYLIAKKEEKMGLLSAKGKVILPSEYDNISGNNHYITPYLLLEKKGKWGQFNCKSAKVLPAIYQRWIPLFDTSGVLFVQQGGYFALFSAEYVQLTEFVFDHSDPVFFGPNLLCLRRGEKYVLTDRSGKQLPIGEMDEFRLLDNPNYAAFKKDHYYGCVRQDGKIILEPKFSGLWSLGRRAIQVDFPDGEAQIYNLEGGLISKESFNVVTLIDESHFLVEKGEFNAVLTFEGEYSIEIVPDFVPRVNFIRCDMGSCLVAENGKMGLFRADGTVILPMEYDRISGALDQTGYFMVQKGKMFGFINWEGEWLTGLTYDFARPFYSGLAPVCSNGKWGYIAENGKVVIPLKFDFAENFGYDAQEAIVAMAKSLWWIDKKGKIIREIPYSERISLDFQHSPIYCITETGLGDGLRYEGDDTWLLKPTGYQLQKIFYNLLVYSRPLMKDEHLPPFGLMDYSGQHITDMVFDEFNLQHIRLCEMIPARKGTKWGFINTKGETVIPFIYDKVWNNSQPIQNGKWLGGVHSNGQSWTIDITGNKVMD